jgi:hypothetical protein
LYDVRFTVPTGVTPFPIAPANDNVPLFAALVAANVTTEFAFVFPASIVPAAVVANVDAFGAVKLNVLPAPDAPFTVTVPAAVSCINTFWLAAFAFALKFAADSKKFELTPPLPNILPFVDVRFAVVAVTVSAALPCVSEFVELNVNVVPADDGPLIVTVPAAVSLIFALVAAFAVMFATFVLNPFANVVPPIPPLVDANTRFVAFTAPVMFALNRLFCELRVTVPTGVTAFPIAAPTVNVPACAFNVTVEFAFAFATSIVAVVFRVPAFVATKLKLFSADDAPFIVTVPPALSLTNTLPLPAFAVTFATFVANGEATLAPTLPFNDARLIFVAFTTPVI